MLRMIVLVAIGWIVGLSARALAAGQGSRRLLATTAVGVGGALVAVVIGRFAGWWHPGDAPGFILSLARRDYAAGALSGAQDQVGQLAQSECTACKIRSAFIREIRG